MKKERLFGPDLLRSVAVILVFFIHSLNYLGALTRNLLSIKWLIYAVIKFTSLACVPLFMILSGFFMYKKTLTSSYYKGIVKILMSYSVISIISLFARSFTEQGIFNLRNAILFTLNYSANGYAWYVEFYIGLFLLIPFLNYLYNALDKKKKLILILSLFFLTVVPTTLKSFIVFNTVLDLLPDYWEAVYPLVYYFAGAFIAEYKPKIKKPINLLIILASAIIPTALCAYFTAKDGAFAWYIMNSFAALSSAMVALALFLFLYDIDISFKPAKVIIREISEASFEIYLFSYITDGIIYSRFNLTYPLPIVLSFAMAFISAKALKLIIDPITKLITKNKDNKKIAGDN